MEVSKKISPQALKVCALWNYFYFFLLTLPKYILHKVTLYNFYGAWERPVVVVGVVGVEWFLHGLDNFSHSFFNAQKPLTFYSCSQGSARFQSLLCLVFLRQCFSFHIALHNLYLGCRDKEKAFNGNHRTITIRIPKATY